MSKQFTHYPYAFFEGKIVPTEDAKISIMTNALQYGTGAFGGIRGYLTDKKNTVALFHVEDHYKRLFNATKILNIPSPYSIKKMIEVTIDLVKKNKPTTDIYLRPIIYTSSYHLSPNLNPKVATFDFALYMIPLGEYLDINKGLKVCVSTWSRINDNMIPARGKITGGYINSSLARAEAEANGFDEAIVLDKNGHVAEGSSENLFIVRDGTIITAPNSSDILEGITRSSIIKIARDLDIPVIERELDRTELYIAEEAFFSGTGAQVAWISSIDRRTIGTGKLGPITQKLQKLFFEIVRGRTKKYSEWRTHVHL